MCSPAPRPLTKKGGDSTIKHIEVDSFNCATYRMHHLITIISNVAHETLDAFLWYNRVTQKTEEILNNVALNRTLTKILC